MPRQFPRHIMLLKLLRQKNVGVKVHNFVMFGRFRLIDLVAMSDSILHIEETYSEVFEACVIGTNFAPIINTIEGPNVVFFHVLLLDPLDLIITTFAQFRLLNPN